MPAPKPGQPQVNKQKQANGSRLMLWLSKLPKHTLPLNEQVARKVSIEINDPDSTSEKLAKLIQQDPVLCLKLYLKGNRQLKEREGDIQGLVHLIGLLGLDAISTIIKQAKKQKMPCDGQRELFSASLFSAHLANHLLPPKLGTRGERFFLPSLLFNAPLWLMWSAAPKVMQHGQTQVSQKKRPLEPLCKKNLGFSLHSLLEQTQVFLPLPTTTLKALEIDFHHDMAFWAKVKRMPDEELKLWLEKDKTAKQHFYSAEMGLHLINHFVLAIYLDWDGKHIKRWTNILSKYLTIDVDELNAKIAEIATHITLPAYLSGQFSPLYRFRGLHKELPESQSSNNIEIIKQYLQQLRETENIRNCLQLTLEALTEGAQVQHCVILKFSENRLQIPLSYGFDDKGLESLDIDFKDCGQLLQGLLKKPMALSVDSSQLSRIEEQLPPVLTLYWQPRPCGLMSLFHEGKPYAIVLCDHKDWNEQRHQQFKSIGKQLTQTLKQCHS
ncbi:MAG: HDOD domain-containing protein [Cellvibrionaceae bacterium]